MNLRNQRKRAKFFDRRGSVVIIRHICAALVCFSLIGFLETYAGELHVVSSPMQLVGENGPGFSLMESSEIGISFRNDLDARKGAANRVLFNGSGVAVGDVNGDGLPDLFFCGIDSPNQFYRNLGQWKFERVTIPTSLETLGAASRGAVFADLNGNDRLDLLVSTIGMGVRVFWNQGEFSFQDATQEFGTETQYGATSMALADVDGNGTLDLYVANYRSNDIRDFARVPVKRVGGKMVPSDELQDRIFIHEGQIHEYGEPDILYLNDGLGKMTPVDWSSGVFRENGRALSEAPKDWGLSVMLRDFSGDGSPDLYVCNDYWTPDRVWINDGHGGFDALPADALNVSSASSMGVDGTDVDGDGNIDLFVVDMLSRNPELRKSQQASESMVANIPSLNGPRFQVNYNTMLLGGGNGRFTDISHFAGLEASDWSWCPIFMDVDLDGIDDVLISAGYPHDMQDSDTLRLIQSRQHSWDRYASDDARQQAFTNEMMEHIRLYPTLEMPMVAFRGKGDGTFEEMTQSWGTDIHAVHQGFATGDLDGDGDLDLVVNCLNGPARLYRNNASKDRVAIRLKGRSPNTQAIGSQITVNHSTFKGVTRTLISGGRYLSGGDTEQVFGILPYADTLDLSIVWPDRTRSTLKGLKRNHHYTIQQPLEPDAPTDSQLHSKLEISTPSVFSDASDRLNHISSRA
ncbi:MAG: CRTAC1 family protein, partial [Verrucomicrobia bacterium]|nr:CRTAC1 family protein [Verrucomicrobiota bacterium]